MYPKLYNNNGYLMAVLDNIIKDTAIIKRVVNGEFTFSFDAFESELKSEYFDPSNSIVIDDQTFDIKYIEQMHETEVKYSIQCEHANYRMADGEENLYTSYGFIGTPSQILADLLSGTEFSVGTVAYTEVLGLVVNTEMTRKGLITQLANLLGGEIEYTNNGFTISILDTIGQDNGFQVRFGKNLKGIRKIIDNRGGLKTTYDVDLIQLKNSNEYIEKKFQDLEVVGVGDTIRIIDDVIGLDVQNRIVSIEYNPIFTLNTKLEIANTISLISDKITQIDVSTVHQGKVYNGVRISPDEGFVSERSDGKAETAMNATDGISIKTDTGAGLQPVFYVDTSGRIKAKYLDIDGSGTFGGELDINNGFTRVRIAPTGDNPFEITYNSIPIFYVDSSGTGVFKGKVVGSEIVGSTFVSYYPDETAAERIELRLENTDFTAQKIVNGILVGYGQYGWQGVYVRDNDGAYTCDTSILPGQISITDVGGQLFLIKQDTFNYKDAPVLTKNNYQSHIDSYATPSEIASAIAQHVSSYHS